MSWQLVGDVQIGYEWIRLGSPITGDLILKIEHSTAYGSFPGKAYALLASFFPDIGLRGVYHRSYPYGEDSDLIVSPLPEPLLDAGITSRYVEIKHDLYARIQSDADWRVKVYRWVYEVTPNSTIDGDSSDGEEVIVDGNP